MKKLVFLSAFIFAGLLSTNASYWGKYIQVNNNKIFKLTVCENVPTQSVNLYNAAGASKITAATEVYLYQHGYVRGYVKLAAYGRSTPYETSTGLQTSEIHLATVRLQVADAVPSPLPTPKWTSSAVNQEVTRVEYDYDFCVTGTPNSVSAAINVK